MEVPIFPSCSYLIVVGASGEMKKTLQSIFAEYQVHALFAKSPTDAANMCRIISRGIGFMVFAGPDNKETRDKMTGFAHNLGVPCITLEPGTGREQILPVFKQFLLSLVPKGLGPAFLESANAIFPTFIKDIGTFAETDPAAPVYDKQINFTMVSGNLLGNFITRLKTNQIQSTAAEAKGPVEMAAQEAANQTLGLIGQALSKLGIQARVGLPTTFNLVKVPEIRTLAIFPSLYLTDAKNRIHLSLGFVDVRGAPLFDFTGIGSVVSSGDVEFL